MGVEQRTHMIMHLMNCLLIVILIYTILMIIPMWMTVYLFRKVLP